MSAVMIDEETGEMIVSNIMVRVETAPAISLDLSLVAIHHQAPQKLVDLINDQAGFVVFGDMQDKKQRKACASHAASIIRCITPAADESKRMAAEAKKVVNQDLAFRRDFDTGVREVAAFHRQPLTDWEAEQARLEAEQLALEEARLAAEKLELDHQDALDMDELRTLRKQREAALKLDAERVKMVEDKRLFDEAVAKQIEAKLAEQQRLNVIEKTRLATLEYTKEIAADKAKQEAEALRKTAAHIEQGAQYADRAADRNAELAGAAKLRQQADELERSFKDDSRELEPTLIKPIKSNPNKITRNRIIGSVAFDFDCSHDEALQIILNEFGIEIEELAA